MQFNHPLPQVVLTYAKNSSAEMIFNSVISRLMI